MIPTIDIAVSGLNAAQARVTTAASNIANASSAGTDNQGPFQPKRVVQSAEPTGGTRARIVPVDPPTVQVFSPDHPQAGDGGTVAFPNVSLASELVETKMAARAYEAIAAVLKVQDEMFGELLDTLS